MLKPFLSPILFDDGQYNIRETRISEEIHLHKKLFFG